MATVMISVRPASKAAFISSALRHFPVPIISRDVKRFPAISSTSLTPSSRSPHTKRRSPEGSGVHGLLGRPRRVRFPTAGITQFRFSGSLRHIAELSAVRLP